MTVIQKWTKIIVPYESCHAGSRLEAHENSKASNARFMGDDEQFSNNDWILLGSVRISEIGRFMRILLRSREAHII
jgi:hypothetical protein